MKAVSETKQTSQLEWDEIRNDLARRRELVRDNKIDKILNLKNVPFYCVTAGWCTWMWIEGTKSGSHTQIRMIFLGFEHGMGLVSNAIANIFVYAFGGA